MAKAQPNNAITYDLEWPLNSVISAILKLSVAKI